MTIILVFHFFTILLYLAFNVSQSAYMPNINNLKLFFFLHEFYSFFVHLTENKGLFSEVKSFKGYLIIFSIAL